MNLHWPKRPKPLTVVVTITPASEPAVTARKIIEELERYTRRGGHLTVSQGDPDWPTNHSALDRMGAEARRASEGHQRVEEAMSRLSERIGGEVGATLRSADLREEGDA